MSDRLETRKQKNLIPERIGSRGGGAGECWSSCRHRTSYIDWATRTGSCTESRPLWYAQLGNTQALEYLASAYDPGSQGIMVNEVV